MVGTLTGQSYVDFGADQVWLQCAPVSWDAFALELFGALLHGATCVLQPGQVPEPAVIARLIAEHGITTVHVSASLLNFLVDEHPDAFDGVTQVMTGGEAASVAHLAALLGRYPDLRLVNGYSPVESMIFTACHEVVDADLGQAAIPVGRPIANKRVYVLDGNLAPVGIGVAGELYMAGVGLADGYVGAAGVDRLAVRGEPVRCGRAPVPHRRPRAVAPGRRARLPRAAPTTRSRSAASGSSRPRCRPSSCGTPRCPRRPSSCARTGRATSGSSPTSSAARTHPTCAGMSPPSCPTTWCRRRSSLLDALPITPNGKLDRAALPAPDIAGVSAGRGARSEEEEVLCRLFADVLGVPALGIDDNFVDLGGHSLLAARLISRIRTELGVELSPRDVFRAPTVADMADAAGHRAASPGPRYARRRGPSGCRCPTRSAASGSSTGPRVRAPTYNVPVACGLRGAMDCAALGGGARRRRGAARVAAHGVPAVDGEPRQLILAGGRPACDRDTPVIVEPQHSTEAALPPALDDATRSNSTSAPSCRSAP